MDKKLHVQLVRRENGELWFYKYTKDGQLEPHRRVKEIIEIEPIEVRSEAIVS